MRKLLVLIGAATALALPALAADDPIAVRQALMQNNAGAAALAGGVLKGELAYSPAVGKAAIAAWQATALAVADFFPEGSADPARSAASPKIWEDLAGFQDLLGKFQAASAAAADASGKDGPADAEAFKAAVEPVLGSCKGCHDEYRLEN